MKKRFIASILALSQVFIMSHFPVASDSPEIDVIVELNLPEGENAGEYAQMCAEYTSKLIKDSESDYVYDTLLCGFHLSLPESSLSKLEKLSFVSEVYTCAEYEMLSYSESENAMRSAEMIGYEMSEELGLTGEGIKIAVIDSGFDVTHPAFDTEVTETLNLKTYAAVIGSSRLNALRYLLNAESLRHNSKIPFRFDYADNDTDVISEELHGTHVAGIIGAAPTEVSNMQGIAPGAQLLLMKIFSDSSATANDYSLIAALEDAIKLKADIINLSLGQYSGSTDQNTIVGLDKLIQKAESLGTVIVCAVGNDSVSTSLGKLADEENVIYPLASYTDYGTLSFPSTADYPLSVASVDNFVHYADHFRHTENTEITPEFTDTNEASGVITGTFTEYFDGKTLEYVVIPGLGEEKDYEGLDLKGKLALIERGTVTFADKVKTAAKHGAIGAIVYNNVEDEYVNMELTGAGIPAIFISREDGLALINESVHKVMFSTDFNVTWQNETAGKISDFSSYGCTPSLTLKPDISGVGGGVLSTVNGGGYDGAEGTSMAAPQISGICALYMEYENKSGTVINQVKRAEKIKTALMNSAVLVLQENGVEYSPRAQGAGLASIPSLLGREVEITYTANGKPKAELFDKLGESVTIDATLKNLTDAPLELSLGATLTSDGYTELEFDGKTDYYSTLEAIADTASKITSGNSGNLNRYAKDYSPLKVTLAAGEKRTVSITVTFDKDYHSSLDEIFTNGHFVEGFIICETENATASMPYMGYLGDWCEAPVIDADFYAGETEMFNATKMLVKYGDSYSIAGINFFAEPDIRDSAAVSFSPNGDGYADSIHLAATNIRNVRSAIFTVNDSEGNVIERKEYEYINKTNTSEGTVIFKLSWKGGDGYYDRYKLPDGKYTMNVTYTLDYGEENTQSYSYPFTLDTTLPDVTDITLNDDELTISAEDENGIYAICVYANETEKSDTEFKISPIATFDISDYEGEYLYYDVIDYAYNVRVGKIDLAELAQ
ncbi:MAG: S8 family serine peptidase [Clostridia bacterium]|nr:S8 family serine peptidase [Clostridia bacterium]